MATTNDMQRALLDRLVVGTLTPGLDSTEQVVVTTPATAPYATASGTRVVTGGAVASVRTVRGLVSDYTEREVGNSGGRLLSGDLKVLVRDADVGTITERDTVLARGRTFRILSKHKTYVGGSAYWTEIQARV